MSLLFLFYRIIIPYEPSIRLFQRGSFHAIMRIAVKGRAFEKFETKMFIKSDVFLCMRFEIDGHISAQLVDSFAQQSFAACRTCYSNIFYIAISVGVIIFVCKTLRKSNVFFEKSSAARVGQFHSLEHKARICKKKSKVAVFVAGAFYACDHLEVFVDIGIVERTEDFASEKQFSAFCKTLVVKE